MQSNNGLGLDLLMNRKKATSVDGGSMADSLPPPSIGAPSIRSVRMSAMPQQDDDQTISVDIDVDDTLDSVSEVPAPPRAPPDPFQHRFEAFRRAAVPSVHHQEDVLDQKREILYQLDRLEKRGVKMPRKFTLASSLEEMQTEYERLKRDRELDASVKFQKRMLMASVTGIEFLNHRFDPFDVKLDGWSESVHENLGDYDEVMEELAEKYRGRGKIVPELKMLMMVSGSAFMFHLQQRYFKSMPGLEQVFQQNPDLMRQFASATMNTMASQKPGGDNGAAGFVNMMGSVFGGPPQPPQPQPPPQRMRGPTGVDDLLKELSGEDIDASANVEVQSIAADSDSDDASLEGLLRATGTLNL
jgi:hypothetical protein